LVETIKTRIEESSLQLQIFSKVDGKLKIEDYKHPKVIAAIIEPIIGEGGIRKINPEFPKILSSYNFPLIVDEIQCGLGRSGSFLASSRAGYRGNYYLFSKALGGNLSKIAAIAIEKERFIKKIGKLYVSTFANGAFAARIATENLRIIERENIPKRACQKGNEIMSALQIIADKYPEVIDSIQGQGLMIGIRFSQIAISRNLFLRVLYNKKTFGYLLSSYMLNIHQIRILPSISAPDVLRVEPSVNISEKDIEKLYHGISDLAYLIDRGNFYQIVKHLMKGDPFVDNKGLIPAYGSMHQSIDVPNKESVKVAFLAHFVYPTEEFRMLSDDLQNASDTGLRYLYNKFEIMMEMDPFLLNARNVFNDQIHLSMYLIPLDSSSLEKLHRTGKYATVIRKIQKAVQMVAKSGIKVISLGGYNSIISNNGKAIMEPDGVKVVTGNTLTAVIGYHNFKRNVQQKLAEDDLDIGIIGATGNIGSILSKKFVNDPSIHPRQLFLFGRNTQKLEWMRQQLSELNVYRKTKIITNSDLMHLKNCNAIINAANTSDSIIFAKQITKSRPVLISDISIPAGISDEIQSCSNVELIPFIASVNLPLDRDFLMTSCSPRGTALCCAAEAILAGFERIPIDLRGDITLEGFDIIYKLAIKHGFLENTKMIRDFKSVISNEVSI
jgi:predicted amino acid dehydrogenase